MHDNDELASKIMLESDPYKLMSLGYKVRGVNNAAWLPEAKKILYKANLEKFTQIKAARDALLATGNDHLGEATQNRTYGLGLHLNDPAAMDISKWTGNNAFGDILEGVRSQIQRNINF
jgi:ribA/ribD-fused uncharacterized protein